MIHLAISQAIIACEGAQSLKLRGFTAVTGRPTAVIEVPIAVTGGPSLQLGDPHILTVQIFKHILALQILYFKH